MLEKIIGKKKIIYLFDKNGRAERRIKYIKPHKKTFNLDGREYIYSKEADFNNILFYRKDLANPYCLDIDNDPPLKIYVDEFTTIYRNKLIEAIYRANQKINTTDILSMINLALLAYIAIKLAVGS